MKRSIRHWISLAAIAAVFAGYTAGCAAPQRRPDTTTPAPGAAAGSTTGDADACSIALGNVDPGTGGATAGATREVTANGILIGNVALVALPTMDDAPLTTGATRNPALPAAPATPATPATPAAPGPVGATTAPSTAGTAAAPGTGAPGSPAAAETGSPGTPGTVSAGGATGTAGPTGNTGPANTDPFATGPAGAPATAPGGTTTPATGGTNPSALDRIRTACTKVAQIRVVNDATDRARLAQIAAAIRRGQPVTDYMDDLTRMSRKATTAATGAGTIGQPAGGAPTGSTLTPAPVGGPMPGTAGAAPGATR